MFLPVTGRFPSIGKALPVIDVKSGEQEEVLIIYQDLCLCCTKITVFALVFDESGPYPKINDEIKSAVQLKIWENFPVRTKGGFQQYVRIGRKKQEKWDACHLPEI